MESKALGIICSPILTIIAWAYALQPLVLQRLYGRALGWIFRRFGPRSEIIQANLERAYPGPTNQPKRKKLFLQSYEHLGRLFLEILMLFGPMKYWATRNLEVKGRENFEAAIKKDKGVIFLASHVGNWELMGATALFLEIELLFVTKHLKPEWLHLLIEKGRRRVGVSGTYEPKTMKDIIRTLKKKGCVGIVLDQYAGPPIGVRVPFFGTPVGTSTAVAALARRTGTPVLPVVNYRKPNGKLVVEIRPSLEWRVSDSTVRELAENTADYTAQIESDIRSHPEQWLWSHRRFKGDLSPLRENEWNEGRARP